MNRLGSGGVSTWGRAPAPAPIAFTQPLSPTCRASKSVLPDEIEVSYQVEPWAGATSSDTNVKRPAPISSARKVGGQQRSALSGVLALENGKNGRQDDQRGDSPPGQATDHGATERRGLRAAFP